MPSPGGIAVPDSAIRPSRPRCCHGRLCEQDIDSIKDICEPRLLDPVRMAIGTDDEHVLPPGMKKQPPSCVCGNDSSETIADDDGVWERLDQHFQFLRAQEVDPQVGAQRVKGRRQRLRIHGQLVGNQDAGMIDDVLSFPSQRNLHLIQRTRVVPDAAVPLPQWVPGSALSYPLMLVSILARSSMHTPWSMNQPRSHPCPLLPPG